MVTKKQNERAWTRMYADFARVCRREFGFLVTKHRFAPPSLSVTRGEGCVAFERESDGAAVDICSEYLGEPWVAMCIAGRSFGLHRQIKRLEPDFKKTWPKGENRALQVAYYARFLRRHAREVLGPNPGKKPPAPAAPIKERKTRARGLQFLATELGWDAGSIREAPTTTLVFVKTPVRVTIELRNGKLQAVRVNARTKSIDLDAAVAIFAPDLSANRPSDEKERLDYYASFFRDRGAALLAGKPSAWSRVPRTED